MTNKTAWYSHPLVSALMVHTDRDRHDFMMRAVASFQRQTWPHKELVLINSTGKPLFIDPLIREFVIKTRFLGEAKNLALYNAEGEWCLPWYDDSDYNSEYVTFHMAQKHSSTPTITPAVGHIVSTGQRVAIDETIFSCFPRLHPHVYTPDGSEDMFLSKFGAIRNIRHSGGVLVTKFFANEC